MKTNPPQDSCASVCSNTKIFSAPRPAPPRLPRPAPRACSRTGRAVVQRRRCPGRVHVAAALAPVQPPGRPAPGEVLRLHRERPPRARRPTAVRRRLESICLGIGSTPALPPVPCTQHAVHPRPITEMILLHDVCTDTTTSMQYVPPPQPSGAPAAAAGAGSACWWHLFFVWRAVK